MNRKIPTVNYYYLHYAFIYVGILLIPSKAIIKRTILLRNRLDRTYSLLNAITQSTLNTLFLIYVAPVEIVFIFK